MNILNKVIIIYNGGLKMDDYNITWDDILLDEIDAINDILNIK